MLIAGIIIFSILTGVQIGRMYAYHETYKILNKFKNNAEAIRETNKCCRLELDNLKKQYSELMKVYHAE
jgi:hypothetical protein